MSTRTLRIACLCQAVFIPLLWASAASAQIVQGTVRDSLESPVGGAMVSLHTADNAVAAALSDAEGAFRIPAPEPGSYRLKVQRIGLRDLESHWFEISEADTVQLNVTVFSEVMEVRGVEAVVDARPAENPRLSRRGFYERKELYGDRSGFASFIDQEAMDRVNATRVSDALRLARGIEVRAAGGRRVTVRNLYGGCKASIFIDGQLIRLHGDDEVDNYVSPSEVIGVEVYTSVRPAQFYAPCASVVIWTGMRER